MHHLTVDDLWRELRSFAETSLRRELEEVRKQIKHDVAHELSHTRNHFQPANSHHHHHQVHGSSHGFSAATVHYQSKLESADKASEILDDVGHADDGPNIEWMTRHMKGFVAQAEVRNAEEEMVEHAGAMHPRVSRRSLQRKGPVRALEHISPANAASAKIKKAGSDIRASWSNTRDSFVHRFRGSTKSNIDEFQLHRANTDNSGTVSDRRDSNTDSMPNSHFGFSEGADSWKQAPSPDAVQPLHLMTADHSSDDGSHDQRQSRDRISISSVQSTQSVESDAMTHQSTGRVMFGVRESEFSNGEFEGALSLGMPTGAKNTINGSLRTRWADFAGDSHMRDFVLALVRHEMFDMITGLLIVVNALTIGFQVDYMVRNVAMVPPLEYRLVEYFFCAAFAIELGLRVFAYRLQIFRIPGWRWNLFDAFVVTVQMAETCMTIIASSHDNSIKFDFSIMRVLRVLRLVRIVRLVRVLRVISELRTMVYSIFGTLKPFCWTVMLLALLVYMVGVQFTQLVADYKVGLKDESDEERPDDEDLNKHFGSLPRGLFSLYQSLTGGIDWGEVCWPLMNHITVWCGVVFSMYIAFAIFALLNVVTGVFVQSAMRAAKEDNDVYLVNHVRELFESTDTDGTGKITWEEFEDQLETKAMREYFKHIDIDISEAQGLFFLLDMDNSGTIDADEFLNGSLRLRGPAKAIEIALIMRTLKWIADQVKASRKLEEKMIVEIFRRRRLTTASPTNMNQEQVPKPKPVPETMPQRLVRPKSAGDVLSDEPVRTMGIKARAKTMNGDILPKSIEDVRSKLEDVEDEEC